MAKTLWSEEKRLIERRKKEDEFRRIVGKEPPAYFIESKIKKIRTNIPELLELAGYTKLGRGWIKEGG